MNKWLLALAARLRFPWLFALTVLLFAVSLFVPDPVPIVDELLLGLLAVLFGAWRRRNTGED